MKLRTHYLNPHPEARLDLLTDSLHPDIDLSAGPIDPNRADFEILIAGSLRREHLLASPGLHSLVIPWAGLPKATRGLLMDYPQLRVHNIHYNAPATAEMAVALLLACGKTIVPVDQAMRSGKWLRRKPLMSLTGKNALILGFGAIGRALVNRLRGLCINPMVIARRARTEGDTRPLQIMGPEKLHAMLRLSDIVLICLPFTDQTKDMIGAEELELLPEGAILVNVSRGPIVQEEPLYNALQQGHLFGAGLDVWYRYPTIGESSQPVFPSHFPFHELDNVVMSPHRAGRTEEAERDRSLHLAKLLNAAAKGEPLGDRVDVEAGY
jgi:phosphoglycerate dehydrogenase-like enzyme